MLLNSIEKAGFVVGKDISLALDVAASSFYKDGKYHLKVDGSILGTDEMISFYENLISQYPIVSIEDGLDEDDWQGWKILTEELGSQTQLVGDDLFVTNTARIKRGIEERSANSVLIKVNQIGSLSETFQAIKLSEENLLRALMEAQEKK